MKKLILTPMALSMAFAAQFALAQGMGGMNFAALDGDSDGAISAEELAAAPPVQNGAVTVEALMTAWDSDGNGSVSEEEFENRPVGMGMGG